MVIAATILGQNGKRAWMTMIRDGQNHLSPNAGIPEAVVAGSLGVQLGGSQYYQGQLIEKPTIGERLREIEHDDIVLCHRILIATAFVALVFFIFIRMAVEAI